MTEYKLVVVGGKYQLCTLLPACPYITNIVVDACVSTTAFIITTVVTIDSDQDK